MATVERLYCPYCVTLLNPGAFVCHGCGAVRGSRRPSMILIFVVFPLAAFFAATVFLAAFGGGFPVWLVAFFGLWAGAIYLHVKERERIEWARGAAAGSMVVPEGRPQGRVESPEDKLCPQCAETVKRAAKVCRFCSYDFSAGSAPASPGPRVIDVTPSVERPPPWQGAASQYRMPALQDTPKPSWMERTEGEPSVQIWPAAPDPPPAPGRGPSAAPAVIGLLILAAIGAFTLWPRPPDKDEKAATPAAVVDPVSAAATSTPATPAPAVPAVPTLLGRAEIAAAQKQLAALGYDVGAADGVAGAKTRASAKSFRDKAGIGGEALDTDLKSALVAASLATGRGEAAVNAAHALAHDACARAAFANPSGVRACQVAADTCLAEKLSTADAFNGCLRIRARAP